MPTPATPQPPRVASPGFDDWLWRFWKSVATPAATSATSGDHASLANLSWTSSGHVGSGSTIAGFDSGGGAQELGTTGTGSVVLAGSPTLTTPNIGSATGSISGNAATVTTNANLTGPITSVGNATAIASQTGTGTKFVMDNSPTLVTPTLGVAAATSINKLTFTQPATSATLTLADGKTLTVNETLTFTGTAGTTMTFPATSATVARTDAGNTFTGDQVVTGSISPTAANGQATNFGKFATTLLAAMAGATVTATNLIPAGSLLLGVTARVVTLITGATSFSVGDGVTANEWGNNIAVAAGTTTGVADFSAMSPTYYAAANNVVLTANGGNFTAGAVRLTAHYINLTAATS